MILVDRKLALQDPRLDDRAGGASTPPPVELGGFGQFNDMDFHRLLRSARRLPEKSGTYAVFIRNGHRILNAVGYEPSNKSSLASPVPDFFHMYTGSSGDLRARVACHVKGDARTSTLRRSLLAAEHACSALARAGQPLPDAANEEFSLDLWLALNAHLVWWREKDCSALETTMLERLQSPLNVSGRKQNPFSRRLMGMRHAHQARVLPGRGS